MTLADGKKLGIKTELVDYKTTSQNRSLVPLYGISDSLRDQYNELSLNFKDNYSIVFRAYNEGMAYRFVTRLPGEITVESEEVNIKLAGDYAAWLHPVGFESSSEEKYSYRPVSNFSGSDTATTSLPVLLEVPNGPRLAILEADLLDYAGLYLEAEGKDQPVLRGFYLLTRNAWSRVAT
jgi:alpha-glucosidase